MEFFLHWKLELVAIDQFWEEEDLSTSKQRHQVRGLNALLKHRTKFRRWPRVTTLQVHWMLPRLADLPRLAALADEFLSERSLLQHQIGY